MCFIWKNNYFKAETTVNASIINVAIVKIIFPIIILSIKALGWHEAITREKGGFIRYKTE